MIEICEGGLDDPQVVALLRLHEEMDRAVSPPESCHVFDRSRLKEEDVTFWSAWEGGALLGVAALKRLSDGHGEIKSMHTAEAARRRGVGAAMIDKIIATAREAGMRRLSLETGSMDHFAPARALYMRCGFGECPPFGPYKADPNSVFMTREL